MEVNNSTVPLTAPERQPGAGARRGEAGRGGARSPGLDREDNPAIKSRSVGPRVPIRGCFAAAAVSAGCPRPLLARRSSPARAHAGQCGTDHRLPWSVSLLGKDSRVARAVGNALPYLVVSWRASRTASAPRLATIRGTPAQKPAAGWIPGPTWSARRAAAMRAAMRMACFMLRGSARLLPAMSNAVP